MSGYKKFTDDEETETRGQRAASFHDVGLYDNDNQENPARTTSQLRFNSINSEQSEPEVSDTAASKQRDKLHTEGKSNFISYENNGEDDAEGGSCKIINSHEHDLFHQEPSGDLESCQWFIRGVVEHLVFRIFTMLLIVVDLCIVIVDIAISPTDETPFDAVSLAISCYFMLEVLLRIFGKGPREFFRDWVNVVDFIIILITFTVTVVDTAMVMQSLSDYLRLIVAGRLVRILLLIRFFTERKNLSKATRKVVSQNKRRYQKDGFDLDLCYITARCIAMSFPSTGLMSWYRNPIREVAKFFDAKHKDHYRIYNLCSERSYDESLFHFQVERILIDDHNVPSMSELLRFAENSREWIAADERNVIAIHCKGGKGRTGTMICTYLVDSGLFKEAEESLNYFGDRRTDLNVGSKFQGVETPSQSRYVGYFDIVKNKLNYKLPSKKILKITNLKITGIQGIGPGNGSDLYFRVILQREVVFACDLRYNSNCQRQIMQPGETVMSAEIHECPSLVDDVKVMFYSTSRLPIGYDKCPFYFWFNTGFIKDNRLILTRAELDNPHKKKTWHVFKEDFGVELTFADVQL